MQLRMKAVGLLLAASLAGLAQDPSWKDKPVKLWNADEAHRVLTDSPWAKSVKPQWTRDLSPDERRAGGDMQADQGKGVGLEGLIGIFNPAKEDEAIARAHAKPDPGSFLVRWESGPVRVAEQKVSDPEAPVVDIDQFYAIVVYDIPTPKTWHIESELKGIGFLKRPGKKDIKPSRVMVQRKEGALATVVYLFPRSAEITGKESSVIFQAQIGRLVLTRVFSTYDMQLQGQLEI
jgi:hypothetical protein